MLKSFKEIIEKAKELGGKKVIIAAADPISVEACKKAKEMKIIEDFEAIEGTSPEEAVKKAVKIVAEEKDAILMKGLVDTATFLRGILDKEAGFRTGRTLSHVAVLETPYYHKLLFISDGGMVPKPDINLKKDIIINAVEFARKFGIERPKVALLAAVEKVTDKIPETLEAKELEEMWRKGEFKDCYIQGPLALDLAVSRRACEIKGVKGEVAGDADILIVPEISAGNISAKALLYLGGAKIGGVICGAKKPCIMLSRADTDEIKLNSIALGIIGST